MPPARTAKSQAAAKLRQQMQDESSSDSDDPSSTARLSLPYSIPVNQIITPILNLPTELLVQIGHSLPDIKDAVFLSSTCKSLQNALGSKNRWFWYKWGEGRAPQKNFEVGKYNKKFDYKKCLVGMLSGTMAKMCCQICFGTRKVRRWDGFKVKVCDWCFSDNVVFISEILHIPHLPIFDLRYETVAYPSMRPSAYKTVLFAFQTPEPTGHRMGSLHRRLAWLPHLTRHLHTLHPGKSVEELIFVTTPAQDAHTTIILQHFDLERERLFKATLRASQHGRQAYVDLMLQKKNKEVEEWWAKSQAYIKRKVVEYMSSRMWKRVNEAMDVKDLPELISIEELETAAGEVARSLFDVSGDYFFGRRVGL